MHYRKLLPVTRCVSLARPNQTDAIPSRLAASRTHSLSQVPSAQPGRSAVDPASGFCSGLLHTSILSEAPSAILPPHLFRKYQTGSFVSDQTERGDHFHNTSLMNPEPLDVLTPINCWDGLYVYSEFTAGMRSYQIRKRRYFVWGQRSATTDFDNDGVDCGLPYPIFSKFSDARHFLGNNIEDGDSLPSRCFSSCFARPWIFASTGPA